MKLLNAILFLVAITTLACTNTDKPKVVYAQDTTEVGLIIDTTAVPVANLPIYFDSTEYMFFVVGKTKSYRRGTKIYIGSSGSDDPSFSLGYFDGKSLQGDFDNIKFQHIDSIHIRALTTNQIKIRSIHLVHAITDIMLLEVMDRDSNKDYQLTYEDVVSLYIANNSGTKFKKLSPESHQLLDWKLVPAANRIYFRTMEDVNRNGEFDKNDRFYHFFVSLKDERFEPVEIFPL